MKPSLVSFASLALLVFAGWLTVDTLSRTPAFNRSLGVETARGGSVVGYAEAMYDRAEYHNFVGYGWLGRIQLAMLLEADASVPDEAVRKIYVNVGDQAAESLRLNPGDPGSWKLYAMAEAALGRPDSALEAYLNWYAVAPHSKLQASARTLFLASFLETEDRREIALSVIDPQIVQGDLTMMHSYGSYRKAAEAVSMRPEFQAFGAVLPENAK